VDHRRLGIPLSGADTVCFQHALDALDVEVRHIEAGVVDACAAIARPDEHQEVGARSHAEEGRGRLVPLDVEAEDPLVEGVGGLWIAHVHRQVADADQRQVARGGRLLDERAGVAEHPGSTAVRGGTELGDQPVRIADEDLGDAVPTDHAGMHRPSAEPGAFGDASEPEGIELTHEAAQVVILERDTPVVDAGALGAGGHERHEARPVPDAQEDLVAVACLDRHAEEALVELERATDVGDGQGHLVE